VENARKHSVAEEIAGEEVSVRSAESLCVALHALSVFGEAVVGLVDAGAKSCNDKWPWIGCTLEKELIFLARSQRKCLLVTGSVEGCHDTENPLMLLLLELHLSFSPLFIFRRCVFGQTMSGRQIPQSQAEWDCSEARSAVGSGTVQLQPPAPQLPIAIVR
jgi:hypothetical protein